MSWYSVIANKLNQVIRHVLDILSGQEEIKRLVRLGNSRQDELGQKLFERLDRIESLVTPPPLPPTPDPITVWRLLSERKENDMWILTYEAKLPAVEDVPANSDVQEQKIKVLVDGAEFQTQTVPRLADVVTFEAPKGKTVKLERSYIDDDGNEGPATASQEFVARDTIPPGAPGDFGEITNLGEREVPDPE
jgi:hypothetical protein